ncbi:MAG TPA: hypothetical protein VKF42_02340 [Chitinivibrionales bacterium]|jgi:hypothetical protein|nr:hypothetical protein [Chitinivibrionales bacterium]
MQRLRAYHAQIDPNVLHKKGQTQMCNQTKSSDPDNLRAEYAALIAYHNSVVTHRFTLLGFFLATVGIIVKGGMGPSEALLILFLTFALYTVERRNRVLYEQMSLRAMEIEQNYWGLNRNDANDKRVPLFHRLRLQALPDGLEQELKNASEAQLGKNLKNVLDKQLKEKELLKSKKPWRWPFFPKSHTTGLDWVYGVVAVYAVWVIVKEVLLSHILK